LLPLVQSINPALFFNIDESTEEPRSKPGTKKVISLRNCNTTYKLVKAGRVLGNLPPRRPHDVLPNNCSGRE